MTYGEAANNTISGLARQPALLLIAVLNVVMLLGLGYVAKSQVEERRALANEQSGLVKLFLDKCNRPS
jgi:Tfp pilus assembly protein PilO